MTRGFAFLSLLSLLIALDAPALAQSAGQKAAAQALFDEGVRLFNAGDIAASCEKFEASLSLVEAVGTRGKLAQCYEKAGRTASAWAMWREVAVLAGRQGQIRRQQFANERAKALESRLSYLTVVVDVAARVPGLAVKRGGVTVIAGAFGTPIAVDPGVIRVTASAPGYEDWSKEIELGEGVRETVTIDNLTEVSNKSNDAVVSGTGSDSNVDLVSDQQPGGGPDLQKIAGISGVGVGAVLTGVGLIFGASANSKWNDAFEDPDGTGPRMACVDTASGPVCSDQELFDTAEDAKSAATLSTVFTITGIAVAAAGTVVWVLAGRDAGGEPTEEPGISFVPTAGPSGAGVAISGRF